MSRKLTAGSSLAQYKIVGLLGEGGMGAVYEALDESLDRHVAIKTLLSEVAQDPESRKRFFREGKAAAKLRHPHVVEVYGVGIEDEIPYLVMELLDGESLAALLDREKKLRPERVIDILVPVMSALVVAHQEGVIHRDLKPDNIFLQKTRAKTVVPKLLDFGISKVTGAHNSRITHTSALMGTPYYMAPEQARGAKEVDPKIDQWAMGVILYESLAGERPIQGETVLEILHRIATMPLKPLEVAAPELSPELAAVIMRALDRDPQRRWPSIAALGHELLAFASPGTRATWMAAFERGPVSEPPPRVELPTDSSESGAVKPPSKQDAMETLAASPRSRPDLKPDGIAETRAADKPLAGGDKLHAGLEDTRRKEPAAAPAASATRPIEPLGATGPVVLPTSNPMNLVVGVGVVVLAVIGGIIAFGGSAGSARDATGDSTPHEGTPHEGTPHEGTPHEGTPHEGTPSEGTPSEGTPSEGTPPEATATHEGSEPPATTPATFAAALSVTPPSARIELDGVEVGRGQWSASLPRDGAAHRVRVSAEGYQTTELVFTDAPPPASVALERARRGGGGARPSGEDPPSTTGSMDTTPMSGPQVGANGSFILQ
ncbi:MAG: protein kinase [Sandaracinaceae bacterium]|nr:protein kinase [Sandaracinaceae bacterium]